jgi:tetratricopeptide (TPR) repeat protein
MPRVSEILWILLLVPSLVVAQDSLADARKLYEAGDFSKVIETLKSSAANNGDAQILLAKSYLQLDKYDDAVNAAEKAVSLNPQNSEFHRWLGEAYGAKADHAAMFSAYGLARKTQKEFQTSYDDDPKNFDAAQDLVEFDCTAPGVVGGGTDKAQPIIQKVAAIDAAEGHYAAGNCAAVKKDYAAADAEFGKAIDAKLKNLNRVFDIADYYAQRAQGEKILAAVALAQSIAPQDHRISYYKALAAIVSKQNFADAETALKQYLQEASKRPDDPKAYNAHYWLGRAYEYQKKFGEARTEYETAQHLNSKYKPAEEGLKRVQNQ